MSVVQDIPHFWPRCWPQHLSITQIIHVFCAVRLRRNSCGCINRLSDFFKRQPIWWKSEQDRSIAICLNALASTSKGRQRRGLIPLSRNLIDLHMWRGETSAESVLLQMRPHTSAWQSGWEWREVRAVHGTEDWIEMNELRWTGVHFDKYSCKQIYESLQIFQEELMVDRVYNLLVFVFYYNQWQQCFGDKAGYLVKHDAVPTHLSIQNKLSRKLPLCKLNTATNPT